MKLYNGDCFKVFPDIEDTSVDLVLCDMPYGTTACKWDTCLDLERMWKELKRISKPKAAIVLTASQPFTTTLICSNREWFKYCWVWQKTCGAGFINSHQRPIKYHEDIVVFSSGAAAVGGDNMCYNPQGLVDCGRKVVKNRHRDSVLDIMHSGINNKNKINTYIQTHKNYPTTIIKFDNDKTKQHPTQKPVALMEYLIKTYSNEGAVVLDFCMGSGTTGVACKTLKREFIGIELLEEYYNTAVKRIKEISIETYTT